MKRIIKIFKHRNFWPIFLVLLLSIPTFVSILGKGYFTMHDDLQIGRLYEMSLCFRDGQFPCRWVPDMGYGFGYPLFNFYPPLPFYVGQMFYFSGVNFLIAAKILFILGLIFSGIFAYLLGKKIWGVLGGLIVAALYLYAPYHALDVYVRGALNEFWGLVLFPAVFWAIYEIIDVGRPANQNHSKSINSPFCDNSGVILLALFTGLLFLSHNLMAVFIAPAAVVWSLFLIWYKKKPFKIIKQLIVGVAWGIGLAAFFTLPVILEKNSVHIETMFIGYFNYLAHFATFGQMFLSRYWGYGASTWGPEDGMPFPIGQVHWILGLITTIVFVGIWFKKKGKESLMVVLFFILFLGYSFLAHERSSFIWTRLPILANAQFPWRFLAMGTFFVSLIGGGIISLIKNKKVAVFVSLVVIGLAIGFNVGFFKPEKILQTTDAEKLFSAKGWNKLQTDAIFDYLPKSAKFPPAGKAPDEPWFQDGRGEIANYKKGTNWQKFDVNVTSETAFIRLPLYYYPKWTVWVDGKKTKIDYSQDRDNELGLISFDAGKGNHKIVVKFKNTSVRSLGNLISLISWLLLIAVIHKNARRKSFCCPTNGDRNI